MQPKYLLALFVLLASSLWLPAQNVRDEDQDPPLFQVEAEVVRVPVTVVDEEGRLYTELNRENFKILEDGQPQEIVSFASGESPITVVILLEGSQVVSYLLTEVLRPAAIFVTQMLEKDDYAALIAYDLKPHILADFTRNRQKLVDGVNQLARGGLGFRESALFDAVKFAVAGGVLDDEEYKGLGEVEGRTAVLLVATGVNTFSENSFDDARDAVVNAGVPIFSIAVGEYAFVRAEPYLSGLQRLTFLQAQNNLKTFSQESGGRFYSVRFQAAINDVLDSIANLIRFEYLIGYAPRNQRREGDKREIEVLVDVDGDGRPDNDRLDLSHRKYYIEPDYE